jgi:excisionase family DNA binding protein
MTTHIPIKEAAARYSVCPDTIRRAIKRRELKAVRLTSGLIRIPVKSLEQWGK